MGTNPTKIALLIGSLCSFSIIAPALAADDTHTARVDEHLVVIGRTDNTPLNIAANVNVIDAAAIEMSGATSLTDVLRGRSGIQISDNNIGTSFAMRGFSASTAVNNTLILLDGRRLNNIDIAAPSLNAIPLNLVERIEILSGSAGVLYGDQAVGGVINIVTKSPENTSGSVQLSGGSFDTYEGRGDISGAINKDWRYFFTGSYNQGDNYRKHNANETGSILGRIQYKTNTDAFFVETSYYDDDRENPGSLTKDQFKQNPRQSSNKSEYVHEMTTAARSGYEHQLNPNWALAADLDYSDTLVTSLNWGAGSHNTRSLLMFSPKALANYTTRQGELNLVTGLDLSRGKADYNTMARSNVQEMQSAYVQATVPLSHSLSYVVGGRYARVTDELVDGNVYPNGIDLDEDATAFEFGLNYRPSAEHRFYLRGDENFRFAKVDEQAYTPKDVYGLKPQTGRSYEAGWDWTVASQSLRVSLYRLDLEDEIVFDPSAEKPVGGSFQGANVNADASRRYGASADWDWQITQALQLGLVYNYIDAEFTDGVNDGKALSWVAKHTGRGYISMDFAEHFQVFAEAIYTGNRFIEGDNANEGDKLASYVLGNLALNYNRDAWLASLRVDNLFDKEYVSSGYYGGGLWDSYYSGRGRDIRLTLGYRF
ncbi:TonB-dependent receptor [Shewanella sp. JNE10-2]|uniref:TonB-dependent receptor n=1 Tax=unclassified Shewanella TaxID=196818 RepID=UPI002005352E|nr:MULTISPECIES: TonB-dependent receptor [unclassified Shewanella]MCK7629090.1 TonB-dependent receptor [Shewanella sp. JNE9-1]MCK7644450.1 TonB-dependent receptor [Shewanella sp. JNE3-1]MCK7652393.1 TonB-dependent receptor [Shewanella sp. JNE4-1]UPO27549.1 TonB-dependent receptor [Shewanella sp. JNE10-2]UPO34756.1 TonB-dependent receptor [Shewanella sp. JNE7]